MRGEYPVVVTASVVVTGSPPLARGILPIASVNIPVTEDHPRLRGEYTLRNKSSFRCMGSPPLARGIRKYCREMGYTHGITPACAGNTQNLTLGEAIDRDHPRLRGNTTSGQTVITAVWDRPRLRGEYSALDALNLFGVGSPPLARGILGNELTPLWKTGITPACAGNTSIRNRQYIILRDHPRLRGEYTKKNPIFTAFSQSLPLNFI